MKSRLAILTIGICILTTILVGCGSDYQEFNSDRDSYIYEPLDLMNMHPTFTFNYHPSFQPTLSYRNENVTVASFLRDYPREPYLPEAFQIEVLIPDASGNTGSLAFMYKLITGNITDNISPDFQFGDVVILESGTIKIDGIAAEYVVYSYHWSKFYGNPISRGVILRRASFSHAGYLWIFSMECYSENAEETEVYWNHLLDTFRFLG
jgi:hypothetical protein